MKKAKRKLLRFPAPGPMPVFEEPKDEAEYVQQVNALHEWAISGRIHQAVHTNDPRMRKLLASELSGHLLHGHPVTPAARRYLSWVLMTLADRNRLPHQAKGRAIDTDRYIALIRRLVVEMDRHSKLPTIEERHEAAAEALSVSVKHVQDLYYSDAFRVWQVMERIKPPSS